MKHSSALRVPSRAVSALTIAFVWAATSCGVPDPWLLQSIEPTGADPTAPPTIQDDDASRSRVTLQPNLTEVFRGQEGYVEGAGELVVELRRDGQWETADTAERDLYACAVGRDTVEIPVVSADWRTEGVQRTIRSHRAFRFRVPPDLLAQGDSATLSFFAAPTGEARMNPCALSTADSAAGQNYILIRDDLDPGRGVGLGLFTVGLLAAFFSLFSS